jgi:hypothetical protein
MSQCQKWVCRCQHNSGLLEKCTFDLTPFLDDHQTSTLESGSEFCPVSQLTSILGEHLNFAFLEKVLSDGMKFHYRKE